MTIFNANYDTIQLAKNCLRDGGLVAFPTETVYGLGADAKNPDAVKRIFLAKNRPENHPLIVHVASFQQFDLWAQDIPDTALKLATHFFPAPLALILKKHPNVNSVVTGGQNTIALRVPNHPIALELLHAFDGGIAAPSANRYCRISPTQAQHVAEELGESVDMILNGGACKIGVESTIIDLSGDKPMLLRFGQITRHELEKVLQTEIFIPNSLLKTTVRTSGMMATHYAPTTISMRCETNFLPILVLENADKKIGVLTCGAHISATKNCTVISLPIDSVIYAQNLYAKLRELDGLKLDLILVEKPPKHEEWQAINDRLSKATHDATD
ncbi:threonylcarbamoyl-AMP synthase [Methylococcaceae bacterium]|nr:threonylcarbamoyl-AMP synthase [Methylococcaceae bacterium]